jgi:hypothetical protein
MKLLGERLSYSAHSLTDDQVQTIKALLEETGSSGEAFLAAIGGGRTFAAWFRVSDETS